MHLGSNRRFPYGSLGDENLEILTIYVSQIYKLASKCVEGVNKLIRLARWTGQLHIIIIACKCGTNTGGNLKCSYVTTVTPDYYLWIKKLLPSLGTDAVEWPRARMLSGLKRPRQQWCPRSHTKRKISWARYELPFPPKQWLRVGDFARLFLDCQYWFR